jgi:hypothetical protein
MRRYSPPMPERARIFTLSETIARALADTPALSGRVHRFDEVTDLALPPGGLFVARVPDEVWSWHRDGGDHQGVDFALARSRFGWLGDVWPQDAYLEWLRTLATPAHPLAYYHDMERGDDLYYAFGWLAGAGEELVVQQTILVDDDACTTAFRAAESAPAARASAFEAVLVHLGLAPTTQFFWPEDQLRESDWPPLGRG